ncbi:Retrovirus-related Pol polyprotein, partial [Mucuna pruriens]
MSNLVGTPELRSITGALPPQSPPNKLKPLSDHLNQQPQPGTRREIAIVLRQHKKSIGWKISDLPGINPSIFMHRILMEEEARPIRQQERRLNPTILDVMNKEVTKLLTAGIIYPISDSNWVSPFGLYNAPSTFQRCMLNIFSDLLEECMEVFMDDFTAQSWELPFELMCDASNLALGAVLGQRVRTSKLAHVIAYVSRTMDPAQMNYTTIEKKLLAIEFNLEIKDKKGVFRILRFGRSSIFAILHLEVATMDPLGRPEKYLNVDSIGPLFFKTRTNLSRLLNSVKKPEFP